jgi:hypothetical protein
MKIIITLILLVSSLLADKGYVLKTEVCGDSDNIIIETTDGWYIAVELYTYSYLDEGDVVFGNMKQYGYTDIIDRNGNEIRVYIEDWETNLSDAYEELCD